MRCREYSNASIVTIANNGSVFYGLVFYRICWLGIDGLQFIIHVGIGNIVPVLLFAD